MTQDALFDLEPPVKATKTTLMCPKCGDGLIASEPQIHETCVNVDYRCEVHGPQFTVSTRTDL